MHATCFFYLCFSTVLFSILTSKLQAELKSGILRFLIKSNFVSTHVDLWLGFSYCDGQWKKVILKKEGLVVSASVNELTEQMVEPDLEELIVNSPVYIGGIPDEVQDAFKELELEQGVLQPKLYVHYTDRKYTLIALSLFFSILFEWRSKIISDPVMTSPSLKRKNLTEDY